MHLVHFPTEQAFALAMSLGKSFLDAYQWLNEWSKNCGRKSFHIVHKHHSFMHVLKNSTYMNPQAHRCFKVEDYVGGTPVSRPIVSAKSTKLSQKLCPKCKVLVRLLLTRAGFAQQCCKVLEQFSFERDASRAGARFWKRALLGQGFGKGWFEGPGEAASKPSWERLVCIFRKRLYNENQESTFV